MPKPDSSYALATWHREDGCPFCDIVAGEGEQPSNLRDMGAAVAFTPRDPVTPGHTLVVPKHHVDDFIAAPSVFASTARIAAMLAYERGGDHNFITSAGPAATQTVKHLHIHLVPRVEGDRLHLPWTGQKRGD